MEKTINSKLPNLIMGLHPYDGVSYYRLRQTDYDGNTEAFNP